MAYLTYKIEKNKYIIFKLKLYEKIKQKNMKSKFLLLLCFYCINATAHSSGKSSEKTAFIPTDEFYKSLNEIADIASQNKLATLKLDKFKSGFNNSEALFNAAKKISGAVESFIEDDNRLGFRILRFEALIKSYDEDEAAAKADFMLIVKGIEGCLGTKANIPSAKGLDAFIHYKKYKVTIHTFFSGSLLDWMNEITIENEPN